MEGETGDVAHWLDPLLSPRSIAVVGATPDPDAVGHAVTRNIIAAGFKGPVWAVNSNHGSVLGVDCVESFAEIGEPIDHAMLAVSEDDIAAALAQAIDYGVRAITIFAAIAGATEEDRALATRLRAMADEANVPLCAGSELELFNFRDRAWASALPAQPRGRDGNVALISQSGGAMRAILDAEERLSFNVAVACGRELTVGLEDYLDWALEQPETRLVGLIMQDLRQPQKFLTALEKAKDQAIPIIALAAGRNSGYDAVFDRFGIARTRDPEELATTLIMFAQPHRPAGGGLVVAHTTEFEAQLTADLAEELGVPLAETSDAFDESLGASDAAMGALILPQVVAGETLTAHADRINEAARRARKPAFLVTALPGTGAERPTRDGLPIIGGLVPFLRSAKHVLDHRDFRHRPEVRSRALRGQIKVRWRERLRDGPLDVMETLLLLSDYQIPVNSFAIADSADEAWRRAKEIGLPVALKPAVLGIDREALMESTLRSLDSEAAVAEAYEALAAKFGADVHVSPMVSGGIPAALSMVQDERFGPLVSIGAGGAKARDARIHALPPFDTQEALRLISRLKLGETKTPAPVDLRALAGAFARFSDLAGALGREFTRIDIDPILATPMGAFVIHAEIVSREGPFGDGREGDGEPSGGSSRRKTAP